MAYICYKPKNSCHSCEFYRFDEDKNRMACFKELHDKGLLVQKSIKSSSNKENK